MKVANKNCRQHVQSRTDFTGSNLYGQWRNNIVDPETPDNSRYIVFSYGEHYPMFIYANGCWFENEDKYSVSTSKHRSQSHPHVPTILLSTRWMCQLATRGYSAIAKERILGNNFTDDLSFTQQDEKQSQIARLRAYFGE
jgi:hypothetical protein